MVNSGLIAVLVFLGVFGGAVLKWWFGGGYKQWLKYRSDFEKEKVKIEKDSKSK